MKVYLNSKDGGPRIPVDVELVEDKGSRLLVRLPDGNVIVRRKDRDMVKEQNETTKSQ
jgi:hypothetical protein